MQDDGSPSPSPPPSPASFSGEEQHDPSQTANIQELHDPYNQRRLLALEKEVVRLQALIQEEAARRTRLEQRFQKLIDTVGSSSQHGGVAPFANNQDIGQCTNQTDILHTVQSTTSQPQPTPVPQSHTVPHPQPTPAPGSSQQVQMTEVNHTLPMECIFKTYLGQHTMFQGKWCYEPTQHLLNEVVKYGHNPPALAREVLRKIFTPYEQSVSNVRGYRKVGLDALRVQTVKMLVVQICHVPISILDHCWGACVRAMDQALRNDRKYLRTKHTSLVVRGWKGM